MNNTFYHLKDHSVCPEVNINNNDKHDKQKTTQVLKQPQNNESQCHSIHYSRGKAHPKCTFVNKLHS